MRDDSFLSVKQRMDNHVRFVEHVCIQVRLQKLEIKGFEKSRPLITQEI